MVDRRAVDYEAAAQAMDDDIRESLHPRMIGSTRQQFVDAYAAEQEG